MADEPAQAEYQISANVLKRLWPGQVPYAGAGNPGFLTWRIQYVRGPTCDTKDDEDYTDSNKEEFWSTEKWEECCQAKSESCAQNGTCPEGCEKSVNGRPRARLTSSEVGYYLDFRFNQSTGLPYGCPILDREFKGLDPALELDQTILQRKGKLGTSDCALQNSIFDETNDKPIWTTVEEFAKKNNLGLWHREFLDAYETMSCNNNGALVRNNHFFMAHGCQCFQNQMDFWSSGRGPKVGPTKTVSNPVECLNLCQEHQGCREFLFNEEDGTCKMYEYFDKVTKNPSKIKKGASKFMVYGNLAHCQDDHIQKYCKAFL